jgi:hypothetical protein
MYFDCYNNEKDLRDSRCCHECIDSTRSKHPKTENQNAYIYFIRLLLFMNIAIMFKTNTMQT